MQSGPPAAGRRRPASKEITMIDENEVDELRRERRSEPKCQCEGEVVGPCPGPLACPNSGFAPDVDEEEE